MEVFQKHGHNEIDTARGYGNGSSEEFLADLEWQKRGLVMGTKIYPNRFGRPASEDTYDLTPTELRRGLKKCLEALKADKVDLFYLHGPDRSTPLEDTLGEVDRLFKEGLFLRFGISNFYSWEVAKICELCDAHGWIRPAVYQGMYNALQRTVEAELIPCLRHYGISLYAFQPLAGGFLTGMFTRDQEDFPEGSRFAPGGGANLYRSRYWSDSYFEAMDIIKLAVSKHGLTVAEASLRWLTHHSVLKSDLGDAVILGASKVQHLEDNLVDVEKGPLPEEVVNSLERAWLIAKGSAPKYWH